MRMKSYGIPVVIRGLRQHSDRRMYAMEFLRIGVNIYVYVYMYIAALRKFDTFSSTRC